MYSKEVVVRCESGLHNKQATYFVQKANEFESSIWLESGNRKMNAKSLLGIMSLGITPFVMTITECAIQIVFNINLNRSTGGNSDYTAALTVMLSALQLISLPLNGLGNGVQPFVSYNYGRGDAKRLKQGIGYVTAIGFVFCVVVWSFSMRWPELYARVFSASETVTEIVKSY